MEKVYSKFSGGGQMQLTLEIWQKFIASLLLGTDAAEAGDLAEVYYKSISGEQMQLRQEILQKFITILLLGDKYS